MRDGPREPRYHVADPYLRFWLRFVHPGVAEIQRGRSELVVESVRGRWSMYRGRAGEPVVREAVTRLLLDPRFGDARHVGGWWTRTGFDVEDLDVALGPAVLLGAVAD